jgi:hypothetical protein
MFDKLNSFHKTRQGYAVFCALELIVAYIFASIAVDTANMWAYLATIVLSIGAIINFVNLCNPPQVKTEAAAGKAKHVKGRR